MPEFAIFALLGGFVPDLIRVLKAARENALSRNIFNSLVISVPISIVLATAAAWFVQPCSPQGAFLVGAAAPELLMRLIGALAGAEDGERSHTRGPVSLLGWWRY